MNSWSDFFTIVTEDNPRWLIEDGQSWKLYKLVDPSGNAVGSYKDYKYAKKQAKYKFKRLQARLERILLS